MTDRPDTDGFLLNGRVRYAQFVRGFRSGIEPVLLAAAVPARPGDRVIEGGSGAGAALLCLAARVPGLHGFGIERDPELVALGARNVAANGFATVSMVEADVESLAGGTQQFGTFDHACANPPFHAVAGTKSPQPLRELAKRAPDGLLTAWAAGLAACLRHRGTLTFIVSAPATPACLFAFAAAGCQATAMLPLWPKTGRPAKLVLIHGIKGGRAALRILPGLVLHEADGRYTAPADAILRDAAALPL